MHHIHITFDFDHVVQYEVGDDHQGVVPHHHTLIPQSNIDIKEIYN